MIKMRISQKLFLSLLFLIYYTKATPTEIQSNIYNKISLSQELTEIILKSENYHYIEVELVFSHQSKYYTTFNEYTEENELYINKEAQKTNQTDLIINSELILGKNKVLLKTNNDNEKGVILSIFLKENKGENDFVYIKYTLSENIQDEIYAIKDTKIKAEQKEGMLFIYFNGINQINNEKKLSNITSDFYIKIFDKKTLESLYENIYSYIYDSNNIKEKPLISKTIKLKGATIKSDMFVKLESNKNDNKEQILLISAKVDNSENEEEIFHYEYLTFKISSGNNNNDGKTEEDEEKEIKENRKKNESLLFIFLGVFVLIIVITFVLMFVYLKIYSVREIIEEDQDYSNIGGITGTIEKME